MKPAANWGWQSSGAPGASMSIRAQKPQAYVIGQQARAAGSEMDLCLFWQAHERDAAVRWREGWFHAHVELEKPEARP